MNNNTNRKPLIYADLYATSKQNVFHFEQSKKVVNSDGVVSYPKAASGILVLDPNVAIEAKKLAEIDAAMVEIERNDGTGTFKTCKVAVAGHLSASRTTDTIFLNANRIATGLGIFVQDRKDTVIAPSGEVVKTEDIPF